MKIATAKVCPVEWTKMRTDVTDALDVNNNSVHKLNNKSSKYDGIFYIFYSYTSFHRQL